MGATNHTSASNPSMRALRSVIGGIRAQGTFGIATVLSVLVIIGFVIYPTYEIIARSFGVEGRVEWDRLAGASQTVSTIRNTIWLGILVGVIGTFTGLAMALVQVRTNFRFKRTLHTIALIPVISPPFAVAMSVITLFGRTGLISKELFGSHPVTRGQHSHREQA